MSRALFKLRGALVSRAPRVDLRTRLRTLAIIQHHLLATWQLVSQHHISASVTFQNPMTVTPNKFIGIVQFMIKVDNNIVLLVDDTKSLNVHFCRKLQPSVLRHLLQSLPHTEIPEDVFCTAQDGIVWRRAMILQKCSR